MWKTSVNSKNELVLLVVTNIKRVLSIVRRQEA